MPETAASCIIQDLTPNHRTVAVPSELGDLSNAEIAGVLGLSLDVVKSGYTAARPGFSKN